MQTSSATCSGCSTTLTRPWACLGCDFLGCMPVQASTSRQKECFRSHKAPTENPACAFCASFARSCYHASGLLISTAADAATGAVFCSTCDDVTYPDTFETLAHLARLRVEEANDQSRETGAAGGSGRRRGAWKGWDGANKHTDSHLETQPTPCRGEPPLSSLLSLASAYPVTRSPPTTQLVSNLLLVCDIAMLGPQPIAQSVLPVREAQPAHMSEQWQHASQHLQHWTEWHCFGWS